ncbi:hypothetical protein [uncultured Veillonella sp.]|uniref:hypothetical protein n=1 Tax=uncultured Veillonella sp. TaxID=159268 RepID=UPI0025FB9E21|nr:hypothetical protein [uncultured Veillonella sp.]
MKFTKRMIVMTLLFITAAVSTGFAYDYVCNGTQANCNTNAQYNCNNNNTVCNNTSQSYCGQNSNARGCGGYRR